tara:strand:+ start:187 stop:294 length:108 start_codon:yes stop_codon:yes gene_type:complete
VEEEMVQEPMAMVEEVEVVKEEEEVKDQVKVVLKD